MAASPKNSTTVAATGAGTTTATPPALRSAPPSVVGGPGSAAYLQSAVAGAPSYSSIAFPSEPLSITLVPLRRPEMFVQSYTVEASEPGDLLHDVLNPVLAGSRRTTWPLDCPQVLSSVSFPLDERTRYLVGEMYRATLVVHNTTNLEVKILSASIVAQDPGKSKRTLLEFTSKTLAPHSTLESRLEGLDLTHDGHHQISTLLHFADPTRAGEMRNASRSTVVNVLKGSVVEDTNVTPIPFHLAPLQRAANDNKGSADELDFFAVLEQRFLCTAMLVNNSGGPLHLTEVVFKKSTASQDAISVTDVCEVPKMLARDGLFLAGERRQFAFEVSLTPSQSAPLVGGSATSSSDSRGSELGTLRWGWRRPNGDGGHGASRPFYKPVAAGIPAAGASSTNTATTTSIGSTPSLIDPSIPVAAPPQRAPPTPAVSPLVVRLISVKPSPARVAEVCIVSIAVANTSQRTLEVAATINADRFMPYFCFAGATHAYLGPIAPRSLTTLQLELLPLMGGISTVDASCVELRAVGAPGPPLWPLPTSTDGSEPLAQIAVFTRCNEDDSDA